MKNWLQPLFLPATRKGRQVRLWAASITAGVLLLTLVFTSGLFAAPLITPAVIYACIINQANAPRVITTNANVHCLPNETKLNWNEQGPKGDPGPKGTSKAYSAFVKNIGGGAPDLQSDPSLPATKAVSVNVPAGNYVVSATITTSSLGTAGIDVDCFISTTQRSVNDAPIDSINTTTTDTTTWPIINTVSTSGQGPFSIGLYCGTVESGAPILVAFPYAKITAIQVDTIDNQS